MGGNPMISMVAVCLAATAIGTTAFADRAEARFETGFAGEDYESASAATRDAAFDQTVEAAGTIARLGVDWAGLTHGQPASPTDPGDPAYDFSTLDAAVQDASERGLTVLMTVAHAPAFAEGPDRPGAAVGGTWKPDPSAFGEFAHALAARYSGTFSGLPRVRYFQAWNEPNLGDFLAPQYEGGNAVAADRYLSLLNAFYDQVKAVNPDDVVLTAGTAPYGDPPGGSRTRPLIFLRHLLCLNSKLKKDTGCGERARFDVLAHHPIDTSGGPTVHALSPNDASTPDFREVVRTLRAAEHAHTVGTPGRHPAWATEIWWESNPPDPQEGVALHRQARWLSQALYLLWRQGASVVLNLRVMDGPPSAAGYPHNASGISFEDGTHKPSFTAWRFPFVVTRQSDSKLRAWGKAPAAGRLVIQAESGAGWHPVKSVRVAAGAVFNLRLRTGSERLRAQVGDDTSLTWHLKQRR